MSNSSSMNVGPVGSFGRLVGMFRFAPPKPRTPTLLWSFCRAALHVMSTTFFQLKVYGIENIPRSGGVLLAGNHQSYLDPVLIGVRLSQPVMYLANQYLFDVPGFGWLIRQVHAFPVQQGKGDRAAVSLAIDKLKEGHLLAIFPEGHRSPDGTLKKLHGGVALVARKANVPVVPVAIDGAYKAWPRSMKIFRPAPVQVMYGKPLDIGDKSAGEIMEELERAIRAMLEELHARRQKPQWK